jgi:hypothetical protein
MAFCLDKDAKVVKVMFCYAFIIGSISIWIAFVKRIGEKISSKVQRI